MNCKKCEIVLRDGAKFCHVCGFSQVDAALPVIAGNEWFSFVNTGNYTLKYKLNTDLQIFYGSRSVGLLSHFSDEGNNNHYYDLVQSENDQTPVVRFVRNDNDLSCVDPVSGKVFFQWMRHSSALGEVVSGSKWSCGNMSVSQSALRSLTQWLPGIIGWLIPSKYSIVDNGHTVGCVQGSSFSFSNSKSVVILDRSRAWELLAVAIILSDDELG